ncbi:hypothetical protein KV564_26410 [Paenibacillus chitinolyticus]|nr:hypothetical protein [Paenibacillus chitinolyticus]
MFCSYWICFNFQLFFSFYGVVWYILGTVLLFLTYIVLGALLYMRSGAYYIRPMTADEYSKYAGHNLIHYTDYLSDHDAISQEQTGTIHLIANGSQESNYSMPRQDRSKKFIWFHLSEHKGSYEPTMRSLWFSHWSEATPRFYKVVLPLATFPIERLRIRPADSAITIEGDYLGKAELFRSFPWIDKKVYAWRAFYVSPKAALLLFPAAFLQLTGKIKDRFHS